MTNKAIKKSISIVIPNWNGKYLLEKNLPSVVAAARGNEIVVVDDASSDGSVMMLRRKFPKVRIIAKVRRGGFASTANAGVASVKSDIVVLLNTDVKPERNFLVPLIRHFSDPNVFAVGSLEKSVENGNTVLRGRGEGSWQKGYFIHWKGDTDKTDTAWVSGGSGAFKVTLWRKLGGMDELYNPFYWEDIDLSYRARKAGYLLLFEPKSKVWHYHEEGKIKREYTSLQVRIIAFRNQFIFIWKNLSDTSIWISHIFWTPLRILQLALSGDVSMLQGFAQAIVQMPAILKRRSGSMVYWKLTDTALNCKST